MIHARVLKKELLERADKWVNNLYTCEKCRAMYWQPLEIGVQSIPKLDLFFIVIQCYDCGHQQHSDPIRLEKFLELTEK